MIRAWLDFWLFVWGKHTSSHTISTVNTDKDRVIFLFGHVVRDAREE